MAAVLILLLAVQAVSAAFVSASGNAARVLSVLVLAAVCAAAALAAGKHKKNLFRNYLTELILEEEFKGNVWQSIKEPESAEAFKAKEKAENNGKTEAELKEEQPKTVETEKTEEIQERENVKPDETIVREQEKKQKEWKEPDSKIRSIS